MSPDIKQKQPQFLSRIPKPGQEPFRDLRRFLRMPGEPGPEKSLRICPVKHRLRLSDIVEKSGSFQKPVLRLRQSLRTDSIDRVGSMHEDRVIVKGRVLRHFHGLNRRIQAQDLLPERRILCEPNREIPAEKDRLQFCPSRFPEFFHNRTSPVMCSARFLPVRGAFLFSVCSRRGFSILSTIAYCSLFLGSGFAAFISGVYVLL